MFFNEYPVDVSAMTTVALIRIVFAAVSHELLLDTPADGVWIVAISARKATVFVSLVTERQPLCLRGH